MQAILITKPGGPDVLQMRNVADPKPERSEVLVRVRATSVNRADLLQRAGYYPPPPGVPTNIPGLEFAGEVAGLGEGVVDYKLGDRVFGLVGGGSYAQYVLTHERELASIPDLISFEEAASLPEACITAYDAMVVQCKLQAGETVLISAVTSGVGTAALQIANAIGACPIGTTRSTAKLEKLKALGLGEIIIVENETFADKVNGVTKGRGIDVVLEMVGGNYLLEDVRCTAKQGRIIVVGLLAGKKASLDLGQLLSKRLTITGTTLRSRPLEDKIYAMRVFSRSIVPLILAGKVRPVIDKVFKLEEAGLAHEYLESNESFGKVVLSV